jgi:SAM-dependent methyltransferase
MSGALREGPKVGPDRSDEAEVLLRSLRSRLPSFEQPLVYSAGSLRQGASWIPAPARRRLGFAAAMAPRLFSRRKPSRRKRRADLDGHEHDARGARLGRRLTYRYRPFARLFSPAITAISILLSFRVALPESFQAQPYRSRIGSGYGFSALTLAAANPHWRVTGIDFSPAHVAAALALAAEAGIANVHLIEADLAALAAGELAPDIPESDVVAAHGLWSWVGDRARAGIVRLLGSRLRPGRLLYICYNAMAARSSVLGMQRLLRDAGSRARKAKRRASRCRARYRPYPRGCKCAAAARPLV